MLVSWLRWQLRSLDSTMDLGDDMPYLKMMKGVGSSENKSKKTVADSELAEEDTIDTLWKKGVS